VSALATGESQGSSSRKSMVRCWRRGEVTEGRGKAWSSRPSALASPYQPLIYA
jgi:hypothetical protein